MKSHLRLLVVGLFLATTSGAASACPNCYGASDSTAVAGMNSAIWVMLGITGTVLAMIFAAGLFFVRRARKRADEMSNELFVDEEGQIISNNDKGIPEWNKF